MKLFGYKVLIEMQDKQVEVTLMDKVKINLKTSFYRHAYICKGKDGKAYMALPEDIIEFL
tara:strand:- start:37 stop:216 length:180 start_codon:yes stop_codon:yes gene_type:complete